MDLGTYLRHKRTNKGTLYWLHWIQLIIGMIFSPYTTIQGLLWKSELVRGDRIGTGNTFSWDNDRINISGDLD